MSCSAIAVGESGSAVLSDRPGSPGWGYQYITHKISMVACMFALTRKPYVACAHRRYVQAELIHSRLAMTAAAGIVLPGVSENMCKVSLV